MDHTKDQNKVKTSIDDEKMIGITIRFSKASYNAIKTVADGNEKSIGDIVRLCVDNRLIEYLKTTVFIDRAHGRDVLDAFYSVCNELEQVRRDINDIYKNTNSKNLKEVLNRMLVAEVRLAKTVSRIMGMR